MKVIIALLLGLNLRLTTAHKNGSSPLTVLYTWVALDYDFPRGVSREELIRTGQFIPRNNLLLNIAVCRGEIFATVPRGTFERFPGREGVPATLSRVVRRNGMSLLEPYPDFASNTIGDCRALQDVVGIAVDDRTGWLWVPDNGRVDTFRLCPPRLVIIDIKTRRFIKRHAFPENVLSRETGFIFEITLDIDPIFGFTRYAYLADSIGSTRLVFDFVTDRSWSFTHPSLLPEGIVPGPIPMNLTTIGGVNGLAVSPNNQFLYFNPVFGTSIWQIPTFVVRNPDGNFGTFVRRIGSRPDQSASIVFGRSSLFYQDFNGFLEWDRQRDIQIAGTESAVLLQTVRTLVRDDRLEISNGLDVDNGFLFYNTNNRFQVITGTADFSGRSGPNFTIGKCSLATGKQKHLRASKRKILYGKNKNKLIQSSFYGYLSAKVTNQMLEKHKIETK